jgi:hypothetical protein
LLDEVISMGFPGQLIADLKQLGIWRGAEIGDCGSQDFAASQMSTVNQYLRSAYGTEPFPLNQITSARSVFERIGMKYTAFDVDGREGTVYLDFHSLRFPRDLYGRFDATFNGGTSEHLIAAHGLFFFMHQATQVGGIMWHQVPLFGWGNHGLNTHTPKFWHQLAAYNRYEVIKAAVIPVDLSTIDPNNFYGDHLSYFEGLKEFETPSALIEVVFRKKFSHCFLPPFDIDDPTQSPRTERLMRGALQPFVDAGSVAESSVDEAMAWHFARNSAATSQISWGQRILGVQEACDLALALATRGQKDDARQLWATILAQRPDHGEAAFQLGWLTVDDDLDTALRLFAKAERLWPGYPPYVAAPALALAAKRHLLLDGVAESADSVCARAAAAASRGDFLTGLDLFRHVVAAFPDHEFATDQVAQIEARVEKQIGSTGVPSKSKNS